MTHSHLTPDGLSIRCERHPTYRAIRPPRVECEPCQWLYENKALSGERSPNFDTVLKVIGALGLKLRAEASHG